MNKFTLLCLNTYANILVVFKEHPLTLWTQEKNVRLCICSVLATNLVFGKQWSGSKAREIGDKIQHVAGFRSLQIITRREELRLKYEFDQNFVT